MATAVVEVEGHIIDSLILAKILDVIVESEASYKLLDVDIGRGHTDPSRARIELTTTDEDSLQRLARGAPRRGA
jgi:hypothetical protein